jgi:anaerobic magnesium-protoporphyrin IX monomethyl ester cyclase
VKIIFLSLYDYHSMGVRGLHALVEKEGHDVESLFLHSNAYFDTAYQPSDIDAVVGWIKGKNPDFLGVGVRSPMYPLFKEISERIRQEVPSCKIVVGGPHPTAVPEECLNHADYAVVGEGESAIMDILNGAQPGVIHGVPCLDLDALPFPYYGENAHSHGRVYPVGKISYNTTRGCFFNCSYCQESIIGAKRRRKSVDRVIDDIYRFSELIPTVKVFTFSDSIFAHDNEWLEEFGDEFIGSKLTFWGNGYAPLITNETFRLLRRAGFSSMRIGVQSGSPYIRNEIFNRKDDLGGILLVADMAHKWGISVHYDFILENPYETPQTLKETRDFIKKLPSSAVINKFELRWWPKTPLTERALSDGYISQDDVEGSHFRLGAWSHVYQRVG